MRIEIASFVIAVAMCGTQTSAQNVGAVPQFQVDPFWPKPLPNNWILGQVSGIATDRYDRIWVVHRPASLTSRERAAEQRVPPRRPNAVSPLRPFWCLTSRAILSDIGGGAGTWLSSGRKASTVSSLMTMILSGSPVTARRMASSSSSQWMASLSCKSAGRVMVTIAIPPKRLGSSGRRRGRRCSEKRCPCGRRLCELPGGRVRF